MLTVDTITAIAVLANIAIVIFVYRLLMRRRNVRRAIRLRWADYRYEFSEVFGFLPRNEEWQKVRGHELVEARNLLKSSGEDWPPETIARANLLLERLDDQGHLKWS